MVPPFLPSFRFPLIVKLNVSHGNNSKVVKEEATENVDFVE